MSQDLSPEEQRVGQELASLVDDPDLATKQSIMRAVMAAIPPMASPQRKFRQWRLLTAAVAAIVLLALGAVGALAASSETLPSNPAYQLRLASEEIRLTVASPKDRELLRIRFAGDRFDQAQQIAHDNPTDARRLLQDGQQYLNQAAQDVQSLPAGDQTEVQGQLNKAEAAANQTENVLDQQQPQSNQTGGTTQPVQANQPSQSAQPGSSGQPVQSGQPSATSQPTQPSQPDQSSQPGQPSQSTSQSDQPTH